MQRVSFPNKLAGEPGISLLFATWLKRKGLLGLFLEKKKNFKGLELICADKDCQEPKALSNYSCGECGAGPLKLQADVIIEGGIEKIVPSTLRIWCPRGHSLYGKRFDARCEKDGARLKYFLVGNERDEFLLYSILELSLGEAYKTTTYYQAYLSCGSNVRKALSWLAEEGFLEKKELGLTYRRWINEPDAYKITMKGCEKHSEFCQILGDPLRQEFGEMVHYRSCELSKIEENLEQKIQRYNTLIRELKVSDLPQETIDKICAEFTPDDIFYKKLDEAIKNKQLPEEKREKFMVLRNQQLSQEDKLELVKEFKMKATSIKKMLAIELKHDLKKGTQTIFPLLEKLYYNPGIITIKQIGCIYFFQIPHLTKDKFTLIKHVPSSYLPQIYEADKRYVDWELAREL
ncbi:MAG: hypothetical protein QW063_01135 [Candidatus Nanoarchaeia archaeon]